ncbi:MAG: AAA family ATPase [Methanomicrobiaceae archaeon]|nr:AAA family ATPase [Methanomicrobiaceae archaeon]
MRTKDLLRYDQTLFRDREVFEFSYVPEQLHHRDAQLRELAELVRGCVHGGRPRSAILRGPPGTGKTTTVRRLFAELGEATRRVVPVYVNCQHDRTQYAVFSCVFEELAGYAPPSTGKHLNDLARGVVKMLEAREAALLVCLDDANYLHEERRLNNLLYRLLRFYEKWDARRTGVFAVSSDMGLDLCAAVDQRVRSVFHPIEVRFPPYSREEIRQILSDRVR